ncbi:MAG: cytochrome bc1 complex diheme cytochrome c subunit [Acidimicrobiia bacterium]
MSQLLLDRRRWSWAVASALAGVVVVTWSSAGLARSETALVEQGRELYMVGCTSCHGDEGNGVSTPTGEFRGPPLRTAGEAGAYYQLSTGRMPLASSENQARRKRPAYGADQIDALVAYVASLGTGPRLPAVDVKDADLARGGELFRGNCAPCHSASGSGGALSYGRAAPHLLETTPREVAAGMRSGPGEMPQFGPASFDTAAVAQIARYVQYLRDPDDRGGLPIGRVGPVPEGFVAWFFGMGALVGMLLWIGTRAPALQPTDAGPDRGEDGNG